MTKVTIDRELLEQVASELEHDNDRYMLGRELRKILAAPRQPDGDHGWLVSLELPELQCNCAWNPDSHDKTCPVYLRDRLSDAQRAIAELRDRLDVMIQCADNYSRMFEESAEELDAAREILAQQGRRNTELRDERDTLRQQLAERDAQIASMRAEVTQFIDTHWRPVAEQRDKLADLLVEVKSDLSAAMNWGDLDRITVRIDAALAEVNK